MTLNALNRPALAASLLLAGATFLSPAQAAGLSDDAAHQLAARRKQHDPPVGLARELLRQGLALRATGRIGPKDPT